MKTTDLILFLAMQTAAWLFFSKFFTFAVN
jgi:hypothetical protein